MNIDLVTATRPMLNSLKNLMVKEESGITITVSFTDHATVGFQIKLEPLQTFRGLNIWHININTFVWRTV